MANIYLKVPTAVAQWYRGRYRTPALGEMEAVELSAYQEEMAIIAADIMLVPERQMDHTLCFSERMWRNILNGRPPQGGKALLKRDVQDWPTMEEVNFLTDSAKNKKNDGYDYLCIAAPKQIVLDGRYRSVTTSYTLTQPGASQLARCMRTEFIRVMLHEILAEIALNDKRGIKRDMMSCIDRFFYRNNMCLGTNTRDRDSMRRMATRWMEEAKLLGKDVKDEYVLHVYEKEREQQQAVDVDTLIEEIKNEKKRKNTR